MSALSGVGALVGGAVGAAFSLTWENIKDWKSSGLDTAVDDLIAARKDAKGAGDYILAIDVSTGWSGVGAEAAQERRSELESACEVLLANIGDLLAATTAAQNGVGDVELLVNEAISRVEYWGFNISSSGEVTDPDPIDAAPSSPIMQQEKLEREEALGTARESVAAALTRAQEVNSDYVEALNKVANGEVSEVEGLGDTPGVADTPPVAASTEEVAAWWNSLTEEEQRSMVKHNYRGLGNLDGIPAWARHEANLKKLDDEERAVNALLPTAQGEHKRALEQQKAEIDAIRTALAKAGEEGQLLLYEEAWGEPGSERAHVAISVGDVDTADHITTVVPGMTTTVESMPDKVEEMQRLKQHSEQAAGNGETTAAIMWLGYDAPQSPPADWSVAGTDNAKRGGDSLASFEEGISDSRRLGAGDAHMSVLGHSYGSTTSSYGVAQVRPGVVDDYAVYGSPGTLPGYDMNVPEGHKYVLRNSNDVIGMFSGALGNEPLDDPSFTELDANDNFSKREHSTYLDEGSTALNSLSKVVAGTAG
ncbi:alpha/beta hydrolase [Actinobaculum sp. 313]|uniref:alpha/beta hydrolase n=1 Tax=Actinobaculum sp. 313 TaxID=2495645 RepID=UPI000D528194|nr:alpha/beta hydrolase [Actinobaculum sp. 313]AWE42054.1 hypothetical protein DDD63_03950 [Actinobaculum sp. 313]